MNEAKANEHGYRQQKSEADSVTDRIYSILLDKIVSCELKPGTKLPERELANFHNTSHTPVRKAINKLIEDGWITKSSGKTATVSYPDPEDFNDLYTLRAEIYKYAAIQAAQLIDDSQMDHLYHLAKLADNAAIGTDVEAKVHSELAFHDFLVDCAHNPYFTRIKNKMALKTRYYLGCMFADYEEKADNPGQLPSTHVMLYNNLRVLRERGNIKAMELALSHHFSMLPELNWKKTPHTPHEPSKSAAADMFYSRKVRGTSGEIVDKDDFDIITRNNPFLQLNNAVYTLLLESMVSGRIRYDDELKISDIANVLCISRNPVREAICRMEEEGFLKRKSAGGNYVCALQESEADNIYYVRLALERAGAALAAKNADKEEIARIEKAFAHFVNAVNKANMNDCVVYDSAFHHQIVNACHNKYIIDAYNEIFPMIRIWVWRMTKIASYGVETWQSIAADHGAILQYIKKRNREDAMLSMQMHMSNILNKS